MTETKEFKSGAQVDKNNELDSGEARDIGAQLFAEADQISLEELEREGAEVRKILDKRIMPIVRCQSCMRAYLTENEKQLYITYCIQFLGGYEAHSIGGC